VKLDEVCSRCKSCDTCETITPRTYLQQLEHKIFNKLWGAILNDPKSSSTLQSIKDDLFNEWGIDKSEELPDDIKFPSGVIVKDENGKIDMSLNSQLARRILKNPESDEKLILMAKRYLDLTDAGSKVDQHFRSEFEKAFNIIKESRGLKWNECFKFTNNLSLEDRDFCLKVNRIVNQNYFKNDIFRYYLPIDQFSPKVQTSGSVNPKAFYSHADEGLKEGGSDLLICQKRLYAEDTSLEGSVVCETEPTAFSDQIREIQHFSSHPSSRFLDLLRLEAIREHLKNYTNLTGELPTRNSISTCDRAYGHSLNNLYEMGAQKFNPDIENRNMDKAVIAKRNRSMIHQLFNLSEKAKILFEVKKEDCLYVDEEFICTETLLWKKNKKPYEQLNVQIQTILNEFPLLGEQVKGEESSYKLIINQRKKFESLLSLNDKEILKKRKYILKKNIVKSMINFCNIGEEGIKSEDLISMKGLRSVTAKNFPGNKFVELGMCLEEMYRKKNKNDQMVNTAKIIGCAGVSLGAGILTFYAGGSGGVATAIGLGCFSLETSTLYDSYIESSIHLENINACMISSPDLSDGDIKKLCGEDSWKIAKKRYEQAASDLRLQAILSPLEILPVVGDLYALKSSKKSVFSILKKRDDLLDEYKIAKNTGDSEQLISIENSLESLNNDLRLSGVSADDLKAHYQSKGLNIENEVVSDSKLPITSDDPDLILSDSKYPITSDDPDLILSDSKYPITSDDPDLILSDSKYPITSDDPDLILSDSKYPITGDDPDLISLNKRRSLNSSNTPLTSLDENLTPLERPNPISGTKGKPHPLDINFFHLDADDFVISIQKKMPYLKSAQINLLKTLDRGTLARLEKIMDLGGDYNEFGKKLLSQTYKHQKGMLTLSKDQISDVLFNLLKIGKSKKQTANTFVNFLSKDKVGLHTLDEFFKNCLKKRNCDEIASGLKSRLNTQGIDPKEISLFEKSAGPYMEYYIPMASKEPLGKHIGKGGFGSVFCRAKSPGCSEVIKIPLDYHEQFIYDTEIELALEYLVFGRAANVISGKSQVVMIKEFIGGSEAGDILFAGKNYSDAQVDDIVELFFDLKKAKLKNPKVLYADIKGNNLKWNPKTNKWVFIDTGARTPRYMFDDPDDFFETFGTEFFFPSWVSQDSAQLTKSIAQWKKVCRKIVSRLMGSVQVRLSPMCNKTP